MIEALLALKNVDDQVIYDVFCDEADYFCICPYDSVIQQIHPRGIDCLYKKDGGAKKKRSTKNEL